MLTVEGCFGTDFYLRSRAGYKKKEGTIEIAPVEVQYPYEKPTALLSNHAPTRFYT